MASTPDRPLVGAIRWDAWHGSQGGPGLAMEKSLGPKRWQYRLPFFAKVLSDTQVEIRGDSQEVMDREIAYARQAGLDYWAFVTYEPDSSMSLGLKYYLSSARKSDIGFCLLTEHGRWGHRGSYRAQIERFAKLAAEPTYQKVLDGRPLLYLGFVTDDRLEKAWGGAAGFREAVDAYREAVRQAGVGNPYIVVMDFDPGRGKRLADAFGCDAVSNYATSAGGQGAPYADLARHAEGFWERCKATGARVVPIVMAGWDRRPRVENPVPWETWQKPGAGIERYYETPTPAELAAHLGSALSWVRANRQAAPANAVIVYAWNENDEGGWLVPTLAEGTARLDAIGHLLRRR